ncbi:MAG: extracellular solute-binding protein [Candidatus Wallbacteria bacterium]|nr:extracellular solute-binding protein [Candidatus Wallbacteria bacterium]
MIKRAPRSCAPIAATLLIPFLLAWLPARAAEKPEVVVYTSVDQVFSEPIFRAFEARWGGTVRAVFDTEETKSTGVLNRLVAESRNPQADVFWSGDPVRPFVLIRRGLVDKYVSPVATSIPASFKATDGSWTGFAGRARVLLVNSRIVKPGEMPRSVRDLAKPLWKGKTAIANPLFGTTTMHVAALFAAWGDETSKKFFEDLKTNEVRIASSNGEVKRLVASGEVAFGLADTDDAHEAFAEHAPIEVVYPDQDGIGSLVMPTAAVLVRGGPHPNEARKLIDYLVSSEVEAKLAQSAAHLPLRPEVKAPIGAPSLGGLKTMSVDYGRVAETMQELQPWLRQWVGF